MNFYANLEFIYYNLLQLFIFNIFT